MNLSKRIHICEILKGYYEHVKIELDYDTPFQLLVAVVLSAQATDKGVNKATKALFEVAKEPQDILKIGHDRLERYIQSIGLYRSKAKNLMRLSEIMVNQHESKVPRSRKALEALPGVGRKTANVVLNVLYDRPTIAVDTHVFRVSNRTGIAKGKTPLDVEHGLIRHIPSEFKLGLHLWLIHHGRYTCVARSPKCQECPIKELCEYQNKNV